MKLHPRRLDRARQDIAGTFDRSAPTYDAVGVDFFAIFAGRLLDDMGDLRGHRVLDAGCGRGAVVFPAAERVGASGSVLGIDLSPAMVDLTARDAAEWANVAVAVMDAQEPDLPPGAFDDVLSSCVVFFLPDPVAGLHAWRTLLAPGGRLGVTTFCGDDPRWSPVREVFGPFIPPATLWAMADPRSPFASTDNFERTLLSVGYRRPTSVVREHDIAFTDPDQWLAWSWSHGQRMFWELVPDAGRAEVEAEVRARLEPLRESDGTLRLRQAVRYTVAHRD